MPPTRVPAFTWPDATPPDCPFPRSSVVRDIRFTGRAANYTNADTWYPSWASDGHLYSPWTDGYLLEDGATAPFDEAHPGYACNSLDFLGRKAATAQARIEGDDPCQLRIVNLPPRVEASPAPYGGRYPSASLVHDGIWYYGTYCLTDGGACGGVGWTELGPFVGFRLSRDGGITWEETPHTPSAPLFAAEAAPARIRIGAPHFVDFGQNMSNSPDGAAYLLAHGTTRAIGCNSWIQGDAVVLLRVTPSPATINDPQAYRFFGGHDTEGHAIWTTDHSAMQPIITWPDHLGSVAASWLPDLGRYIMCVTRGMQAGQCTTMVFEAPHLTGPWHIITTWQAFGPEAYFVHIPTKFWGALLHTGWLSYSANWSQKRHVGNPLGSCYALSLHEIALALM